MRLGVIGELSDWLIASAPYEAELQQRLGMELVRVPMEELIAKLEGTPRDPMEGAEGCAEYFLRGPIGNHHIIFCGDYNELFKAFVSVVL